MQITKDMLGNFLKRMPFKEGGFNQVYRIPSESLSEYKNQLPSEMRDEYFVVRQVKRSNKGELQDFECLLSDNSHRTKRLHELLGEHSILNGKIVPISHDITLMPELQVVDEEGLDYLSIIKFWLFSGDNRVIADLLVPGNVCHVLCDNTKVITIVDANASFDCSSSRERALSAGSISTLVSLNQFYDAEFYQNHKFNGYGVVMWAINLVGAHISCVTNSEVKAEESFEKILTIAYTEFYQLDNIDERLKEHTIKQYLKDVNAMLTKYSSLDVCLKEWKTLANNPELKNEVLIICKELEDYLNKNKANYIKQNILFNAINLIKSLYDKKAKYTISLPGNLGLSDLNSAISLEDKKVIKRSQSSSSVLSFKEDNTGYKQRARSNTM